MKKANKQQPIAEHQQGKDDGRESGEPAVDADYEYLNMSFWVDNKTNTRFTMVSCGLSSGKWMEGPGAILPNRDNQLPFRSCGKAHMATGTEGWVRFQSDQYDATFTVSWDVPWGAQNGYLLLRCEGKGSANYDCKITHYDPRSNDPNPKLAITKVIGRKSRVHKT